MPIYTFKCEDCKGEFEDFRNISEKEETGSCLSCGSKNISRLDKLEVGYSYGCGCGDTPSPDKIDCDCYEEF